jgi:hypothetical protein
MLRCEVEQVDFIVVTARGCRGTSRARRCCSLA